RARPALRPGQPPRDGPRGVARADRGVGALLLPLPRASPRRRSRVGAVSGSAAVAAKPGSVLRWADAVGHCVLVFAFLPTLAALPSWLAFEARNPLNASDPLVLVFLPVRGAI